jgi:hypothetical protein
VCRPSFRVVESWSFVNIVCSGLCVNLGSCGCVSTLGPAPFNELIFWLGIYDQPT